MTTYIILDIIQTFGISLGVGSSTLAVFLFFAAIKDGKIEPPERALMGINYIILRVAMVVILITTASLVVLDINSGTPFTSYLLAQITSIFVLFLNAILMTARIMPSSFGPAIQASSWYVLGFLLALEPHGLTNFTYLTFFMSYLAFFALVALLIRFEMGNIKKRHQKNSGEV